MKSLIAKGLILSCMVLLSSIQSVRAQDCPGATFHSQSEVDAWLADNSACSRISGSLEFRGKDIVDLSGFSGIESITNELLLVETGVEDIVGAFASLREVGDDLLIEANDQLRSLSGAFPVLQTVGFDINIYTNELLEDINGFDALTEVVEDLRIRQNPLLKEIKGFEALTVVGDDFIFEENNLLIHLDGFPKVKHVGHQLQIRHNAALKSINGFTALESIADDFEIVDNESLTTVLGFIRLTSVNNNFEFLNNPSIVNINSFEQLRTVGDEFRINNNSGLLYITGFDQLQQVGDDYEILDNPMLVEVTGFPQLMAVGQFFQIKDNGGIKAIAGFERLIEVGADLEIFNNGELLTISGFGALENVGSSLEVENNFRLEEIDAFYRLDYVHDDLEVVSNASLRMLRGFSKVTKIMGNLEVMENPKLKDIIGFEILRAVGDESTEDFQIMHNASLESIAGFDQLERVMDRLELEENPMLVSVCGFTNILQIQGYEALDLIGNGPGANSREQILGSCVAFLSDCTPTCHGSVNASLDRDGNATLRPADFISNDAECASGLLISVQTDWGKTVFGPALVSIDGEFSFNACPYLINTLTIISESSTTSCETSLNFKQSHGPTLEQAPVRDVYCFDPLVRGPGAEEKDAWAPCEGTIDAEFVTDWVQVYACEMGENDTIKTIFREWAAYDKEGRRAAIFDTIVVFQLPEIDEDNIYCSAADTIYCGDTSDFQGPYFVIPQLGGGRCDTIYVMDVVPGKGRDLDFVAREFDAKCGVDVFIDEAKFGERCEVRYRVEVEIKQFCYGSPQAICTVSPSAGEDGNVVENIDEGVWKCQFWLTDLDTLPPVATIKGEELFVGPLDTSNWIFSDLNIGNSNRSLLPEEEEYFEFFNFDHLPYRLDVVSHPGEGMRFEVDQETARSGLQSGGSYFASATASFTAEDFHSLNLSWDFNLGDATEGTIGEPQVCANIAYYINGRPYRFVNGEESGCAFEGTRNLQSSRISLQEPILVTESSYDFARLSLKPGDEVFMVFSWIGNVPATFRLYGMNFLATSDENCETHSYLPSVDAEDVWGGIKQIKATVPDFGTVEFEYDAETDCYKTHERIRIPHRYEPYRVYYEFVDSCHLFAVDSTLVFVKDFTAPVPAIDKGMTVSITNKKVWINAEDIDEGTDDNCNLAFVVARRVDWAKKCIDLCSDIDTVCALDEYAPLLKASLETDKEIDPVEAHYAKYLSALSYDNGPCVDLLYNAWQYDLIKEASLGCSPEWFKLTEHDFTHYVLECRENLDSCFYDVYTDPLAEQFSGRITPDLVKVYENIGGGWTDQVFFDCEDVCTEVAVEVLAMDYWCNYSVAWTPIWVEDKSPFEIVKDVVTDQEVSCAVLGEARYNYPGHDERVDLNYILAEAKAGVIAAELILDEIWGGYEKAWPGYASDVYLDANGNEIDCDISFVDSTCTLEKISKKVKVYNEHLGYQWIDSIAYDCVREPDTLAFSKGIVLANCTESAVCDQDLWYEFNHCGEGIIKRTFKFYRSCGEGYPESRPESAEAPDTVFRIQYIHVRNKCDFNKYAFDVPESVEVGVCDLRYDDRNNLIGAAGPSRTGIPTYKFEHDCRQYGLTHQDKVFKVLDGAEGVCYKVKRTWFFADWCASSQPDDDRWWLYPGVVQDSCVQELWLTDSVPPQCEIMIPAEEDGLLEISACSLNLRAQVNVTESCGIDSYTWKLERKVGLDQYEVVQVGSEGRVDGDSFTIPVNDLPTEETYRLKVTILDGCHNEGYCIREFEVVSIKKPTPICLSEVTAKLNPMDLDGDGTIDTAFVDVWANEFDRSSGWICGDTGLDFKIELLDGVGDDEHDADTSYIRVGCAQIGVLPVRVWTISMPSKTYDYCDVLLDVLPPDEGCPDNPGVVAVGVTMVGVALQESRDKRTDMKEHPVLVLTNKSDTPDGISASDLSVSPNPFQEEANVTMTIAKEGMGVLRIVDMSGKVLDESSLFLSEGVYRYNLQSSSIPSAGIYYVQLLMHGEMKAKKLVKI